MVSRLGLLINTVSLWLPSVITDGATLEVKGRTYSKVSSGVKCYIEDLKPSDAVTIIGDPDTRAAQVVIDDLTQEVNVEDNSIVVDEDTREVWVFRGMPRAFREGPLPHLLGVVAFVEVIPTGVADDN